MSIRTCVRFLALPDWTTSSISPRSKRVSRAYLFVRYHSHDYGAGHVAWGFEWDAARTLCGSVENHSGRLITKSDDMGFWSEFTGDPGTVALERKYEDVKIIDVPDAHPIDAYRVAKWIGSRSYRVITRNCEDDCYDVLRAYGVRDLEPPLLNWLPSKWFSRVRGAHVPLEELRAERAECADSRLAAAPEEALSLEPLHPAWRRFGHSQAIRLAFARITRQPA